MLAEIRKYENLGTVKYFWELFQKLNNEEQWTLQELNDYFSNRIIDNIRNFDGCIPLLLLSNVVYIDDKGYIVVGDRYKNMFHTETFFRNRLIESFFRFFIKDDEFCGIFTQEYISYDLTSRSIGININAFGFKYANIRDLLLSFGFLDRHSDFSNILLVNAGWKDFFNKHLVDAIKRNKLLDALKYQDKQKVVNGFMAEEFVMNFEAKRLQGKKGIIWVSIYDDSAGYDISSFNTIKNTRCNRFIEVKSYVGSNPYFYWTRNEVKEAKKSKNNYFVYLVDRHRMDDADYEPEIINNPIDNILNNEDWLQECDKYLLRKN